MKTQIVNIDPHDDYGSVRDKLQWAKALRVILVWPGRGDVLTSRLDLVLLKRFAQQRRFALGLLTFDPRVMAHARELSIPILDIEPLLRSPVRYARITARGKRSSFTSHCLFEARNV